MTIRRYRESILVQLSQLNRQLPLGAQATSVSRPEPHKLVDIDVPAGAETDLDEYMDSLGYEFVETSPGTTIEDAAESELPGGGGGGGSFDMRDVVIFDHFFTGNNDPDEAGIMGWREFKSGTGNDVAYSASVAGRPGVLQLISGTGGSARACIALGDSSITGGRFVINAAVAGAIEVEFLQRWVGAASILSANLEDAMFGFGLNWNDDAEILSGLYFRFNPLSSPNWFLVSANSGTRTAVNTGIAATASTWKRLGVIITPGAPPSAQAYHNGAPVGTPITTNFPTSGVGFGLKVRSAGGGVNSVCEIDYVIVTQPTLKED